MSVIETPFGFLEVGKEGNGANAAQSGQAGFGVAPERLDAIDVAAPPGEFVGAVVNPVMFVAFENQAVVSAPSIGKDDAFINRRDMSLNHLEEFSFRTIGQGGTDDPAASFEKTDNRDFPRRSEGVEFREFGVFTTRLTKQRVGRNPKKPEQEVVIPPRAIVKFKAGKIMKQRVLERTPQLTQNHA
jgi:hypothetical protein